MTIKKWCNIISGVGILLMVVSSVYLWRMGVFSSQEKLREFIAGFGVAGGLVFVFIQIVQVVIPIIPRGISCLTGVILFGAGMGFVYDYVGIDLGLKDFLITSDGEKFDNQKFLSKSEKLLKRIQKKFSKSKADGKNHEKLRIKLAKRYEKVSNQRKDYLHKLSVMLIKRYYIICLESLKVQNMIKNHRLAKSIQDVSWSEFVQMLQYKADWYGRYIQRVDTYYPSIQLCSCCGYKNIIIKDLSIRSWICPNCNAVHDRDINASINILNQGLKLLNS